MLRIAKLTDYATLVLAALAEEPTASLAAAELAPRTRLEPPTVAKVLKKLAKAGLVDSKRGAAGGYRIARAAESISVADVVAAIEGPIGIIQCQSARGDCRHHGRCGVQQHWRKIGVAIETALRSVTIADLVPARGTRALSAAAGAAAVPR